MAQVPLRHLAAADRDRVVVAARAATSTSTSTSHVHRVLPRPGALAPPGLRHEHRHAEVVHEPHRPASAPATPSRTCRGTSATARSSARAAHGRAGWRRRRSSASRTRTNRRCGRCGGPVAPRRCSRPAASTPAAPRPGTRRASARTTGRTRCSWARCTTPAWPGPASRGCRRPARPSTARSWRRTTARCRAPATGGVGGATEATGVESGRRDPSDDVALRQDGHDEHRRHDHDRAARRHVLGQLISAFALGVLVGGREQTCAACEAAGGASRSNTVSVRRREVVTP